ncbi:SymE family type I addiction module toxin [Marinimicrobium sp. C6131]
MPRLQMKGQWLDQTGSGLDVPVTVRVMGSCVVLTAQERADR